jgi:hypothetical protein
VGTCLSGFHDGGDGTCLPVGTCGRVFHPAPDGTCVPCPQNITLRIQNDIDGIAGCKELLGGIGITQNVFDLTEMQNLERVGSLQITEAQALQTLAGLENLDVTGTLVIARNPQLISAELNAVKETSFVFITDNPALSTISLAGVVRMRGSELVFSRNQLLTNISLDSLTQTSGTLVFQDNPLLVGIFAPQLRSIQSLFMSRDAALSADWLSSVETAGISIEDCPSVLNLDGLGSLSTSIGVGITRNQNLTSIRGLQRLVDAHRGTLPGGGLQGGLLISNNAQLPQCQVDALFSALNQPCTGGGACTGNDPAGVCE